ncbi:MAG: glutamate-cysteine ligase family protein [Candidatus Bathyarchaeota archaeon]|nr:glutamate-cysteine ligase family protein [Candidatus Bathyarchaeota archaeon]
MGPEHEFSLVDDALKPLPIADQVIKGYCGKIMNFVELPGFTFGKEMQLHVMELKANAPFQGPRVFEETMQKGVTTLAAFLKQRYGAHLLGAGMHPLLKLDETGIWTHRHSKIYREYGKIFNLQQHGWLNIQSFHLNLPYQKEADGVLLHNLLANMCPYLPAVSASSPIYEGALHGKVDNRLAFYKANQQEVPSISGDVVPEYISSFDMYRKDVIGRYSRDLAAAGASETILFKEWVNSRGVIFRFDRSALEVRMMDEQECVKSDVALSCFVRAALRGLISGAPELLPHNLLVCDFNAVLDKGLDAEVQNPYGPTARHVCQHLFDVAWQNATDEEKNYLPLVKRRLEEGNLSDVIRQKVLKRAQRTDLTEAITDVYSTLIKCLEANKPYF